MLRRASIAVASLVLTACATSESAEPGSTDVGPTIGGATTSPAVADCTNRLLPAMTDFLNQSERTGTSVALANLVGTDSTVYQDLIDFAFSVRTERQANGIDAANRKFGDEAPMLCERADVREAVASPAPDGALAEFDVGTAEYDCTLKLGLEMFLVLDGASSPEAVEQFQQRWGDRIGYSSPLLVPLVQAAFSAVGTQLREGMTAAGEEVRKASVDLCSDPELVVESERL